MPLVFVHGVNNRRGASIPEQQVFDNRMTLLREHFRGTAFLDRVSVAGGLAAFTPYWGDLGVEFARNLACIPKSGIQALSAGQTEIAPLTEAAAASLDGEILKIPGIADNPLLILARARTLGATVDLLYAGGAFAPVEGILLGGAGLAEALAAAAPFAAAAQQYAAANPHPAWLAQAASDEEFMDRLFTEVQLFATMPGVAPLPDTVVALGFGNTLKTWLDNAALAVRNAVGRVQAAAGAVATVGVRETYLQFSSFVRPSASTFIGHFFGDVFAYMENRQPIIDRVLIDIDKAVAAKRVGDEELYLVGHSFGGIILYDILTKFRPDLACDLLVTVGSQVALFAEIGRLADHERIASAFAVGPKSVVSRPANVARWINAFDSTDLVGFGTAGVFSGARDFRFETDALPLVSHGAYFDTPRFFSRLRERVQEAFANGTD